MKVSLELIQSRQSSSLFILFNQQWFIALWNNIIDEDAPESEQHSFIQSTPSHKYKEEVCLALLEASLLIQSEITQTNEDDLSVRDAWLLSSVEAAEICSKVFDWKIR